MAEDVLCASGFVENVNYLKQKTIQGAGSRPDFTFLLPRGLRLNMDVKFPFDNYMRSLDAQAEGEKARFRADFLRDVKAKVREVATRDYINPEQQTLDCALLLIANEQIYAFIQEQDSQAFEEALRQHVVCCSRSRIRGPRGHQAGHRRLLHGGDLQRIFIGSSASSRNSGTSS